jgi:hypothetical protein
MHSYDPLAILKLIYRLIFGGAESATDWASRTHQSIMDFFAALPFFLINLFAKYAVFSFFLSIALIVLIIIYALRQKEIEEKIMKKVLPIGGDVAVNIEDTKLENQKWILVEEHINSEDPNKWKLAILEADIILSELLESLGLPGESVGEKLKAVEESDFTTIESAWEAHKIRNAIAHQGSDFLLTKREAKRIINLYKTVFEEFKII